MFANGNRWITRAMLAGGLVAGAGAVPLAAAPNVSERAEISGVQTAAVPPVLAIKAAEAKAGGHALGFGYEKNASTNAYEVTVATSSGLQLVQVDPVHGTVLGSKPQPGSAMAGDGLPASAVHQAAAAHTSLATAVVAAEHAANGRALEGNYALRNGRMTVDVDVARKGVIRSVFVNPASGHVSQVASAKNGAQDGHDTRAQASSEGAAQDAD